jgi:hypothetical protein
MPDPADELIDEAAPLRASAASGSSPLSQEKMSGVIEPVKRATASRLGKAGIAIPPAADLRGLGWAAIGAARFAGSGFRNIAVGSRPSAKKVRRNE